MLPAQIAIVALLLTPLLATAGAAAGLTDRPGPRKQHPRAVPLTGGISIFLTMLVGFLILGVAPYTFHMLVIAALVFLVGVFDDFRHIRASLRLAFEYAAGWLLAAYGGIAIHQVGDLLALGDIPLLMLSVPLTALAVAGLSNAYNMIDGIDGLAAVTLGLPLLVLYCLAAAAAHPMADSLLLMLVPLAVFLVFNLGPDTRWLPRIFLGDGGSVTLGFLVTASLVYFSQGEAALIVPVTALWLVTLPLMDMLATMLRRARQGRSLFRADRSHLHHTLIDMGFSPRQTLLLLASYALACGLLGLALENVPAYLSLAGYVLLFLGHCAFVLRADARRAGTDRSSATVGTATAEYCEPN